MASSRSSTIGVGVYASGVILLALLGFVSGAFDPGQPVPHTLPHRALCALAANALMLLSALALPPSRTRPAAAAVLAVYYILFVVVLMNGRVILANPETFGVYSGAAEQLAIGTAAFVVWSFSSAPRSRGGLFSLRVARGLFGSCAVLFGLAHFAYLHLTAPLVPAWLPPSRVFWAEATGICQIAAGAALITGVRARAAAALLTLMYAAFTPLVHLPRVLAGPGILANWSEAAETIALTGAAWILAAFSDIPARRRLKHAAAAE